MNPENVMAGICLVGIVAAAVVGGFASYMANECRLVVDRHRHTRTKRTADHTLARRVVQGGSVRP